MGTRDDVTVALELVEAVQATLVADLLDADLDPAALCELPGWTCGHLLTHLARNADSVVRRLDASAIGTVVSQYEGGVEGRAAGIEVGRSRPFAALVSDVESSGARISVAAASLTDAAWSFETLSVGGQAQTALVVLQRRAREVVIHHTDLGIGFTPEQWPNVIVDELVDECLPVLDERTTRAALAGWLVDRSPAPRLEAWG